MTDDNDTVRVVISRRSLLESAPIVAGAIVSVATIPGHVFAQTKLSHELAKYQDQPKDGQQCSTCIHFEPPSACKVVENPISPNGWCQLYAAKSA